MFLAAHMHSWHLTQSYTFTGGLFQLRLIGMLDCDQWQEMNTLSKLQDIADAVAQAVDESCECGFTASDISEAGFICFLVTPDKVTYRARINQTISEELVTLIQMWADESVKIAVAGDQLIIDGSCTVNISSFDDPGCHGPNHKTILILEYVLSIITIVASSIFLVISIITCAK